MADAGDAPEAAESQTLQLKQSDELAEQFQLASANDLQQDVRRELVVIDRSAADYQQLVDDLLANEFDNRRLEVFLLDADRDGVEQITEALAGLEGIDAIHLISHGDGRGIQLGDTRLDVETAAGYAGRIASWADSLDVDADLLIYGCN